LVALLISHHCMMPEQ